MSISMQQQQQAIYSGYMSGTSEVADCNAEVFESFRLLSEAEKRQYAVADDPNSFYGSTPGGIDMNGNVLYLIGPKFINPSVTDYMDSSGTTCVSDLSQELIDKLGQGINYGNGNFSVQNWADVCYDLLVNELITIDEYHSVLGRQAGASKSNGVQYQESAAQTSAREYWAGNPTTWIQNQIDANFQSGAYHLSSTYVENGYPGLKPALEKVLGIIDDILVANSSSSVDNQWEQQQMLKEMLLG